MVEQTRRNGSVGHAWSWEVALRGVISPLQADGQVEVESVGLPPAEPWTPVAAEDTGAIEAILRRHQLLPESVRS